LYQFKWVTDNADNFEPRPHACHISRQLSCSAPSRPIRRTAQLVTCISSTRSPIDVNVTSIRRHGVYCRASESWLKKIGISWIKV